MLSPGAAITWKKWVSSLKIMKNKPLFVATGAIALTVLGGLTILTNPGSRAYEEYATKELQLQLKERGCSKTLSFTGLCNSLADRLSPQIEQIVSESTERRNFVFFSIYYTDLFLHPSLPSYHFETVGVLQNFIIYKAKEL